MGGTLLWPIFQRERWVCRSPRCHRMPAHHGWVRLRAVGRRTQEGHRQIDIRQGPRQWRDSHDLIKHSNSTLVLPLNEVLCQCWQEGAVPHDTRDLKSITLYKNKGERNDCNNYRGISLLSIVGKVFTQVILIRLQKLAEPIYPESQCGFRAARSPIDMVFCLRQLKRSAENSMPLCIVFIDLTMAFDLVSSDSFFRVLPKIGCPLKPQSMIGSFHNDTKGTVQFNGSFLEPFEIRSGIKQGCVLAPTLFGIFFGLLLKHVFDTTTEGIYLRIRSDGRIFKPRPPQSQDKGTQGSHQGNAVCRWRSSCDPHPGGTPVINVLLLTGLQGLRSDHQSEEEEFTGTGQKSSTGHCHRRLWTRCCLSGHLHRLHHHWQPLLGCRNQQGDWEGSFISRPSHGSSVTRPKLYVKTKIAVYNACVTSTLLYGSDTWTTYAWQERRLNTFHLRSIRFFFFYTLLRQRRLWWFGHVRRIEDGRIPKDILYGELALGRTTGRPHLRYKDVCVRDVKAVDIDTMSWEVLAADRTKWRSPLKQHINTGKTNWWLQQRTSEHAERRAAAPSDLRPHIDVLSATKTAAPALVFSVISDAATTQQEINIIKNENIRLYHPRSSLTEGSLYEEYDL